MRSILLGFIALAALSGCGVKGSCDRRKTGQADCIEVTSANIKDMKQSQCTSDPDSTNRGAWTEKKACDRTSAIAGCETNLDRTWYFGGGRLSKPEHVKQLCSSGKLLDANGKELKDVKPEKLPDGPANDPALEAIISSVRGPLETNVAAIEKLRLPAGASGAVRLTGGKHVLAGPTVAAVYDEDLTNFVDQKASYRKVYPLKDGDDLHACGIALRSKQRQSRSDAEMGRILKWCSQLTTLIVVRTTKLDSPVDKGNLTDFHTGLVEGNVTVFELPTGKVAGSYAFKAVSSDKVKASQLESDFFGNYEKALTTGLAKSDPGATYTFDVQATRN